jgi:quercetin dioxygenase-like cupin family protein
MDISPLLQGLEGNMCQSPHWGYVIKGAVTVSYSGGEQETVRANDIFYWPPGHTVRVDKDAEVILFSPQHEHTRVLDHMIGKMPS